ncbi:hypothetical protein JTB14_031988 [Gonioctena quinquepunctata]|nr:hypothetical protein JTB14_031988 [Gonioctena quinquepunctata]
MFQRGRDTSATSVIDESLIESVINRLAPKLMSKIAGPITRIGEKMNGMENKLENLIEQSTALEQETSNFYRMHIVDDLDIFYDVDGDLMDIADTINPERTYNLRVRIVHFNYWYDSELFNKFCLSKSTVMLIFDQIEESLQNRTEKSCWQCKDKIIDLVVRWRGSAHKSKIFENPALKMKLLNGEMRNGVLVGDQGYRLQSFLLTFLGETDNEAERLYNEAQIGSLWNMEEGFQYYLLAYDAIWN